MKKIILLFALSLPLFLSAQLTSDDFESYSVGAFDGQWDTANWVGWFGGSSNVDISDEQANSGTHSMKVEMNDDIVALLGKLDEQGNEVSFMQYIPSGSGAYFNLQHNYTNTAGSWMIESYATPNGLATFGSAGAVINYPIVYDQWAEIKFIFNFITGQAEFSYNGTPIATFFIIATANGAGLGINQLNAINFFGTCAPAGCTSLAYYDDVQVTFVPAPPHNARVINPSPPSEYTTVPNGLEKPITLSADVQNIGAENITNVTMTFNLKDGSGATIYTETTDPVASIGSGETATFTGTGPFTLTGVDNFTMDYELNIAETDSDLADNMTTLQVPFAIDDNIYARDDGNYGGSVGILAQRRAILGQTFDFVDMATVGGIFFSYQASAIGEIVNGLIYSLDAAGNPDTLVATSEPFSIVEVDTSGNPIFVTLEFADEVVLMPGNYLFAVEQPTAISLNLSISPSVYTPMQAWGGLFDADDLLTWNNLEAFNIRGALSVRPLVSLVGTSIDESAVNYINDLRISPNPTQDVITIDLELLETQDLSVEVYDTNGQLLKSLIDDRTIGGQYRLNLKEFPSGVYYVKFQIGEQFLSRRVVLAK